MPNWCYNELTITGPPADVAHFVKAVRGKPHAWRMKWSRERRRYVRNTETGRRATCPLLFERIVPYPPVMREHGDWGVGYERGELFRIMNAITGNGDPGRTGGPSTLTGYSWSIENWGTKWELGPDTDLTHADGDEVATYAFDTAWSPPVPVVLAASQIYPALTFDLDYEESGNDFAGSFSCKDGQVLEHERTTYFDRHPEELEEMEEGEEEANEEGAVHDTA